MKISHTLPLLAGLPLLLSACGGSGNDTVKVRQSSSARQSAAATSVAVVHTFIHSRDDYSLTSHPSGGIQVAARLASGQDPALNAAIVVPNNARLRFDDISIALDADGVAGKAYRLYRAAFGRLPDTGGLGYWMGVMDKGGSLENVADVFASSPEFKSVYGAAATHAEIVARLYQNVLNRSGEPGGVAYWNAVLDSKQMTVAEVLVGFSESAENKARVLSTISRGIAFKEPGVNYQPVATARGLSYEGLAAADSSAAALAHYDGQGARGYALVGKLAGSPQEAHMELYATGAPAATYDYELVAANTSAAARLANMQLQGAKGFLYKSTETYSDDPATPYDIFVKSSTRGATYSYRIETGLLALDKVRQYGAEGYSYRGQRVRGDGYSYDLYVRDNQAGALIEYGIGFSTSFNDGLLKFMNEMGAQSFGRFESVFLGASTVSMYERTTTRWAPVEYSLEVGVLANAPVQQKLDVIKTSAANGRAYYGDHWQYMVFYTGGWLVNPEHGPVFP